MKIKQFLKQMNLNALAVAKIKNVVNAKTKTQVIKTPFCA
jgi:hypothetical protein